MVAAKLSWLVVASLIFASAPLNESVTVSARASDADHDVTAEEAMQEAQSHGDAPEDTGDDVGPDSFSSPPVGSVNMQVPSPPPTDSFL